MAKTKPNAKQAKKKQKCTFDQVVPSPSRPAPSSPNPFDLLDQARAQLQEGGSLQAAVSAKRALDIAKADASKCWIKSISPALNLLGQIYVELGDVDIARQYFLQAVETDEREDRLPGRCDVAEKYLWLAQLSEEGGHDSVHWFEKGARSLRYLIEELLPEQKLNQGTVSSLVETQRKLAIALCSVVEVYMTDLSWEEDAEQKCEALITEATMVAPDIAEPWQTLANVRISQKRPADAREALIRSMDLWKDLPPDNAAVPDFPTRVSLARLLLEVGMESEAIEVLERLVSEDDNSVEVWYLGGWGLYILGERHREEARDKGNEDPESWKVSLLSSQQWLQHCLRLYEQQKYEDERLGAHARELVASLSAELGGDMVGEHPEDGDEWEDEDEEGTEEEEADEA